MAAAQRPDWLTELIAIVQRLCPETGVSALAAAGRARKFGRVSRDAEQGAGWFWTGLAGRSPESDQLEAGYLAPAEGSEQHRFQLIESVQEGNVLKVRVGEHAPAEGLFLWIPGRAPGLLEKSLLDRLRSHQPPVSHARHRALTRVIWCGVRQDTRMRSGLATMIAIALAREVATFSRCRS